MYPRSGTQHIAYFKRFKMEIDLVEPPLAPTLPAGFYWVPWEDGLLDLHADVLFRSFMAGKRLLFPAPPGSSLARKVIAGRCKG
jgi:hypothetical protein